LNKKILFGSLAVVAIGVGAYFYSDIESNAVEKMLEVALNERVETRDITSYSSLTCTSTDDITCTINDLVSPMSSEAPEKSISFKEIKISHIKDFMHFSSEDIALANGSALELEVELNDIQLDNHPIFYDKTFLEEIFQGDTQSLEYITKHFNQKSSLSYNIKLNKENDLLHVNDHAHFSIGEFNFKESSHILSKASLNELKNSNPENSMSLMPKIVIEDVHFDIQNPKGFLLNFYYISYKNALSTTYSAQQVQEFNMQFDIESDKVLTKQEFIAHQQKVMMASVDEMIQSDKMFAEKINKNNQFKEKMQSIIDMNSDSISIEVINSDKNSIADFSAVMMSYMLTQSFGNSLNLDVKIK